MKILVDCAPFEALLRNSWVLHAAISHFCHKFRAVLITARKAVNWSVWDLTLWVAKAVVPWGVVQRVRQLFLSVVGWHLGSCPDTWLCPLCPVGHKFGSCLSWQIRWHLSVCMLCFGEILTSLPTTSRELGMSQRSNSLLATEEADAVSSLMQSTKSYLYPMEGYWVFLFPACDLAKGFLNKLSKSARLWQYWKESHYSSFIVFF